MSSAGQSLCRELVRRFHGNQIAKLAGKSLKDVENVDLADLLADEGIPNILYKGHVQHEIKADGKKYETYHENNGHLTVLDDPRAADRLWGTFAYNGYAPNPEK